MLVACNSGVSDSSNNSSSNNSASVVALASNNDSPNVSQPLLDVTWVSGSKDAGFIGSYSGTNGARRTDISPGGSMMQVWRTKDGKIWVHSDDDGLVGRTGNNVHDRTLSALWNYDPKDNTWLLVKVESAVRVRGLQGVGANSNTPGARGRAATWVDTDGNLWLYGGDGVDDLSLGDMYSTYGDLWKFDTKLEQWIWVRGDDNKYSVYGDSAQESASFSPNIRSGGASWADESGNLWMFGGHDNVWFRADVWKYNIARNMWSLETKPSSAMSDPNPASSPIAALIGASAAYNGNGTVYIFGGATNGGAYGRDSRYGNGTHDDLWAFNLSTAQWVHVGGSYSFASARAGELGVENANNYPSARTDSNLWFDKDGYLWLFGGLAITGVADGGRLADFWRYNPSNNQWALMSGTPAEYIPGEYHPNPSFNKEPAYSPVNQFTVHGKLGQSDFSNSIGGRNSAGVVYDKDLDTTYLFGGMALSREDAMIGYPATAHADLWKIKSNVMIRSLFESLPEDQIKWGRNSLYDIPGNQYGLFGLQLFNNSNSSFESISLVNSYPDANAGIGYFGEPYMPFPANGALDDNGSEKSDFSIDVSTSTCFVKGTSIILKPGASCSLVVRYQPTSPNYGGTTLKLQAQFVATSDKRIYKTDAFYTAYSSRNYAKCYAQDYGWYRCNYGDDPREELKN